VSRWTWNPLIEYTKPITTVLPQSDSCRHPLRCFQSIERTTSDFTHRPTTPPAHPRSALLHSTLKENSMLKTNNFLADNNNTRRNSFQIQGSCNFSLQKLSKTCYDFPYYKSISTHFSCQTLFGQLLVKCTCQITIKSTLGLRDKRQSTFVTLWNLGFISDR
jgi:hypothetical protein